MAEALAVAVCAGLIAPEAGCRWFAEAWRSRGIQRGCCRGGKRWSASRWERGTRGVRFGRGHLRACRLRRAARGPWGRSRLVRSAEIAPSAAMRPRPVVIKASCCAGVFGGPCEVECKAELWRGHDGDQRDDAADGARAVEICCAAAQEFHVVEREQGELVPVDPAAEGVVERDFIGDDEGAAGGRAAKPAQREAPGPWGWRSRSWCGGKAGSRRPDGGRRRA